eukprot:16212642-Heterocapsa_arctica.AAC.1
MAALQNRSAGTNPENLSQRNGANARAWIDGIDDLPGNEHRPTVADEQELEDTLTMRNPASQGFFEIPGDPGNGVPPFEIPDRVRTPPNPPGSAEQAPTDPWNRLWLYTENSRSAPRPRVGAAVV